VRSEAGPAWLCDRVCGVAERGLDGRSRAAAAKVLRKVEMVRGGWRRVREQLAAAADDAVRAGSWSKAGLVGRLAARAGREQGPGELGRDCVRARALERHRSTRRRDGAWCAGAERGRGVELGR
jgi:hypothetical protein